MIEEIIMSSTLCTLEKEFNQIEAIKAVGEILPGVIVINDLVEMKNIYMNNNGCNFLNKSSEQLIAMGSSYFDCENFCSEETNLIKTHLSTFIKRNDKDEVTSFYRRVKKSKEEQYEQFYLTGKLLKNHPGCVLFMAVPAIEQKKSLKKINTVLNNKPTDSMIFKRFNTLSKREKQILKLITNGFTNKQISEMLYLSVFTVETHRKNVMLKLDKKSISELVRISDLFSL